jgi:hypothetical protein
VVFIGWLVLSILVGVLASNRGRSGLLYFFFSVLLSPLIGLVLVLIAGENKKEIENKRMTSGEEIKCPFCVELIKSDAKVCKHCGRDLPEKPATNKADSSSYY